MKLTNTCTQLTHYAFNTMIINKFSTNMGNMGCAYDEFFPQAESEPSACCQ